MKSKPKLGQNFLVDEAARVRIVDAQGDVSATTVVEIGPGHGAITSVLAARCRRLIAIELDRNMIERRVILTRIMYGIESNGRRRNNAIDPKPIQSIATVIWISLEHEGSPILAQIIDHIHGKTGIERF